MLCLHVHVRFRKLWSLALQPGLQQMISKALRLGFFRCGDRGDNKGARAEGGLCYVPGFGCLEPFKRIIIAAIQVPCYAIQPIPSRDIAVNKTIV